jgi:hypothetical protein
MYQLLERIKQSCYIPPKLYKDEYSMTTITNQVAITIEVLHKRVYGQNRFYPVNENAKCICDIVGCQTLTKDQLKRCKAAGWEIVIKTDVFNLD